MATGPVKHGNEITRIGHPPMLYGADGRYVHTFRQSWVNTYWDCPERARREAYGLVERTENDAASVGTAFHAAAEDAIHTLMHDGILLDKWDLQDLFDFHWEKMQAELDIQFVKRKLIAATAYGRKISMRWGESVLPTLDPFATELAFGPILLWEDPIRVILGTGSIDYVDQKIGLVDWKSASQDYKRWEKQRWAVQPSFYDIGFRSVVEGMVSPFDGRPYQGPFGQWNYCVMPDRKDPEPQWVPVTRSPGHELWLTEQLIGLAEQLEATEEGGLTQWPKRDQHALCSEKWCPSWSDCKGKYLNE